MLWTARKRGLNYKGKNPEAGQLGERFGDSKMSLRTILSMLVLGKSISRPGTLETLLYTHAMWTLQCIFSCTQPPLGPGIGMTASHGPLPQDSYEESLSGPGGLWQWVREFGELGTLRLVWKEATSSGKKCPLYTTLYNKEHQEVFLLHPQNSTYLLIPCWLFRSSQSGGATCPGHICKDTGKANVTNSNLWRKRQWRVRGGAGVVDQW